MAKIFSANDPNKGPGGFGKPPPETVSDVTYKSLKLFDAPSADAKRNGENNFKLLKSTVYFADDGLFLKN